MNISGGKKYLQYIRKLGYKVIICIQYILIIFHIYLCRRELDKCLMEAIMEQNYYCFKSWSLNIIRLEKII